MTMTDKSRARMEEAAQKHVEDCGITNGVATVAKADFKYGYEAGLSDPQANAELLEKITKKRDAYAEAMAIALREGIFVNKELVKQEIEAKLKEVRG